MSFVSDDQPPRNRLTIAHLMLWTVGTAIALGFYRSLAIGQEGQSGRIIAVSQALALTYSLPAGARIGGFLLFALKRLRGERGFPSQPGQWLLVIEGLSALASFTGRSIASLFAQPATFMIWSWAIGEIPNCLITTIAYGLASLWMQSESRLWKTGIWGLVLQHAAALVIFTAAAIQSIGSNNTFFFRGGLLSLYMLQATCFSLALAILIPLAAFKDPLRHHRDFLHWTGIATLVCITAIHVAVPFVYQLAR